MTDCTLDPLSVLLDEGVDQSLFSCAVAAIGDATAIKRIIAVGEANPETGVAARANTTFDCASVTKAVVTTTVVLRLVENGALALDDPLARHLSEIENTPRGTVALHQLLTHTSGLEPYRFSPGWEGLTDARAAILDADLLAHKPGLTHEYSCLNFVHLALVAERVADASLPELAERYVFEPLGMNSARIGPIPDPGENVAVTRDHEHGRGRLRGKIHDPIANTMVGRSGNAGLFATATDLARFAQALLNEGTADQSQLLAPTTVATLRRDHTPPDVEPHGLGWRLAKPYWPAPTWSPASFGHTGYTGTSLWLDPAAERFAVLLTNEVYTGKENSPMSRFRKRFHGVVGAERY